MREVFGWSSVLVAVLIQLGSPHAFRASHSHSTAFSPAAAQGEYWFAIKRHKKDGDSVSQIVRFCGGVTDPELRLKNAFKEGDLQPDVRPVGPFKTRAEAFEERKFIADQYERNGSKLRVFVVRVGSGC